MIYNIKIVRKQTGEERTYPCAYYGSRTVLPDSPAARGDDEHEPMKCGITLDLGPSGPVLRLPEDGDVAYVTNDHGRTVAAFHWPPRRQATDGPNGVKA